MPLHKKNLLYCKQRVLLCVFGGSQRRSFGLDRLENGLPVRMPLPRASAEGLPGGGIYALHTTIENKAFGIAAGLKQAVPKL